jgi:hypothetical protein
MTKQKIKLSKKMNTLSDPSVSDKSSLHSATFGMDRMMGLQQSFAGASTSVA